MKHDYKPAILNRISRRSFLTSPIDMLNLSKLSRKIEELNAESGLNITLLDNGSSAMEGGKSYGLFSGVRSMFLFKGDADVPYLCEKIGYYGELLILFATELGLGTCWVGGTFDRTALNIPSAEKLICVAPVGNVRNSTSIKEKFLRGTIHRKSKTVEQLINTDVPLSRELQGAMELVKRAPTTRNLQRATFLQKNGEITAHVPGDSEFELVDLGICKLHFECGVNGKFELGNGGKLCL